MRQPQASGHQTAVRRGKVAREEINGGNWRVVGGTLYLLRLTKDNFQLFL